ncbi:hypothetical protein LJB96_03215 [Methanobrevibacter sp. OttesenSCG-928-K11]|nr:hypothetical protein [Methanobrevibacter sp. OttesenSCG-928-K11]MDL2270777.1 hypothetical protein [Methanobrevibacter sp. OttesenSCG-928-I08]
MNNRSLEILEESIEPSGKWISLEIANDSIYLEFRDVQLGRPQNNKVLEIAIRFANNAFICFFYNEIWDIEFLKNYDFSNQSFFGDCSYKVKKIKFQDFNYLDEISQKFNKEKIFPPHDDFDVYNLRNDFFLIFELDKIAICVSGNEMDFFNEFERLNDDLIKELSNQWILYFLDYCNKTKMRKDSMCEDFLLK